MDCLLALCLYLTGGIGPQHGYKLVDDGWIATQTETNVYGMFIGEAAATLEYNHFYIEGRHISGINTAEHDLGLNTLMIGLTGRKDNTAVHFGVGIQSDLSSEFDSNSYGDTLAEASITQWFGDGMFVKASKVSKMSYIIVGLSADIL